MTDILAALGGYLPTVTPMAALLLIILSIYKAITGGTLIPESTYSKIIEAKDKEIATLNAALTRSDEQISKLVGTSETMLKLVRSLPGLPGDDEESEGGSP